LTCDLTFFSNPRAIGEVRLFEGMGIIFGKLFFEIFEYILISNFLFKLENVSVMRDHSLMPSSDASLLERAF
jgi:hypothetical protein